MEDLSHVLAIELGIVLGDDEVEAVVAAHENGLPVCFYLKGEYIGHISLESPWDGYDVEPEVYGDTVEFRPIYLREHRLKPNYKWIFGLVALLCIVVGGVVVSGDAGPVGVECYE